MIIVLSAGGVIEFFLFSKYKVLLIADQKIYILDILQAVSQIVSTVIILFLIQNNVHYLIVRLMGAIISISRKHIHNLNLEEVKKKWIYHSVGEFCITKFLL